MDLLKIPYEHPFTIEWKLKKAELETLKDSTENDLFTAQPFPSKIAGVYYNFKILPFGANNCPSTMGKTRINLNLFTGNVKEVKAKYVISIESANILKNVEQIFKASKARGLSICESTEFFDPGNKYFVNDEIIIKIEGTLKFDRPLVSKLSYPFSTKGTFKAADLEAMREEIGGYVESETFEIPSASGIKYNLRIYPNGPYEEFRETVFIAIYSTFEKDKKIETYLTFTINSGLYSKNSYDLVESYHVYGYPLCSTQEFFDLKNGYIVDGGIVVQLDGHIFVEKNDPQFLLYFDAIETGTLETTEYDERNFVIAVDGQEIAVNKDLLANVSTVFAGMMKSGMKETIENRIEITDFPFKTVDSAIKLLNEISPTFVLEDMLPLLVFADKYDFQIIKDLIEDHLIKELCTSNVCQLIHFATIFNAPKLFEKSAEFFIQCSHEKTAVNDFDLIDKETAYKIFSSALPSLPY